MVEKNMSKKNHSLFQYTQSLFLTTLLCTFLCFGQTPTSALSIDHVDNVLTPIITPVPSTPLPAPQLILDGTFIDNGRLAPYPAKGCISGTTDPTRVDKVNIQTVHNGILLKGNGAVDVSTGRFEACLNTRVPASTTLHDVTLFGKWKSKKVTSTTLHSITFDNLIYLDGQSNMMYPGYALDSLRAVTLTNSTALLNTWAADNFYGITIMSTVSSNVSGSLSPQYNFAKVSYNWTRASNSAAF
jgi:hypothetical protein